MSPRDTSKPVPYEIPAVRVEAMLLSAGEKVMHDIANWCGGIIDSRTIPGDPVKTVDTLLIPNLETMRLQPVLPGYYVVKDTSGRFSIWAPDSFAEQFKRVGLRGALVGEQGPELTR